MKNVKLTFVIVAALILNVANSYASGSVAKVPAEKQFRAEIAKLFDYCPYESMELAEGEYVVKLSFLVDENKKIINVDYTCESEAVGELVKTKLESNVLKVPEDLVSRKYTVSILFKVNML